MTTPSRFDVDKLHKLHILLQKLNAAVQNAYPPLQTLYGEEPMIPFKGRSLIKQYAHKTHMGHKVDYSV